MAAVADLVEMRLSEEDAQVWHQEVREKIKQIYLEWHEKEMLTNVDIGMVRGLVEEIKRAAGQWLDRMHRGEVKVREGYERNVEEKLQRVIELSDTFLEITADWVIGEPEDPKEAIPKILEEMGKRFESLHYLLGGHSPELIDAKNAFKEWRDAIIGAVKGAKEVTKEEIKEKKEEIKEKKDNFIKHWQSFEGKMIDYNWFGSITAMEIAAAIGGLYHDLLHNLFELELL
jgi:gas vesicle protein